MTKMATADAATGRPGEAVAYPYSQGDLLSEKPVYNFSAFKGAPFLHAYAAARRAWLAGLPADSPSSAFTRAVLDGGRIAQAQPPSGALADILEGLCLDFAGAEGAVDGSFLRLVQRFEVTKRLWSEVDERFRPAPDAVPAQLREYALFGLTALLLNNRRPHLSLLNAALKAHDIVTSQEAGRVTPEAAAVARLGIGLELETVAVRAGKAGVAI